MSVDYASGIGPRSMHGAVNDEARLMNERLAAVHDVSVEIDADKIRCSDFLETQSELVNQELLLDSWDPGRDMRVDEIRPMEQFSESVAGCEVDAHLPLGVADVWRWACLHHVACRCHHDPFSPLCRRRSDRQCKTTTTSIRHGCWRS